MITVALFTLLGGTAPAQVEDTKAFYGGAPKLVVGRGVKMASEKILIHLHPKTATYDCTFVLKNQGGPCKITVGFPDQLEGPLEKANLGTSSGLSKFQAYLDGKSVQTTLRPDTTEDHPAQSWHTLEISFKKGQTRVIRETFSEYSIWMTGDEGAARGSKFILDTGASWKAPIGLIQAEVIVDSQLAKKPLHVYSAKNLGAKTLKTWHKLPKQAIVYTAFAPAQVKGNTLKFSKKNVKPKTSDNIEIFFDHASRTELQKDSNGR